MKKVCKKISCRIFFISLITWTSLYSCKKTENKQAEHVPYNYLEMNYDGYVSGTSVSSAVSNSGTCTITSTDANIYITQLFFKLSYLTYHRTRSEILQILLHAQAFQIIL